MRTKLVWVDGHVIQKRKLGVTRGPCDPGARLPLWFDVSSLLLCAVTAVLLLIRKIALTLERQLMSVKEVFSLR